MYFFHNSNESILSIYQRNHENFALKVNPKIKKILNWKIWKHEKSNTYG